MSELAQHHVDGPAGLPRWLVSSPYARRPPRRQDRAARPHGLHHARQVGSSVTACGLLARDWPFFWDLGFGAEPEASCPRCDEVVRGG